jgi:hypothetical protein
MQRKANTTGKTSVIEMFLVLSLMYLNFNDLGQMDSVVSWKGNGTAGHLQRNAVL